MDAVKRHLFLILCAVAAIGGVALAVTGIRAMPAVNEELVKSQKLYDELGRLKPANEKAVDATQKRIDQIIADRDAVFDQAKKLYRHQPLVAEVFPKCDSEKRRQFRSTYKAEMQKLFESLRAGRPPVEAEVDEMRRKIQEEEFRQKQAGVAAATGVVDSTPGGVPTKEAIRKDPVMRAAVAVARNNAMYAVHWDQAKPPDVESSLQYEPAMQDTGTVDLPNMQELWIAQWRYWLQKDVVDAIVALNEEAAVEARDRNEERWIGTMSVKELISIRVSKGLVMPSEDKYAGASPGGYNAAIPPAAPKAAFTQTASTDFYDVMQFTVKVIMDQRDVLRLVEKITDNSFHTCLRIAYKEVEFNKTLKGKIYGSEPVVNVVMDFETVMLGDYYRQWMPGEVCKQYNIACAHATGESAASEEPPPQKSPKEDQPAPKPAAPKEKKPTPKGKGDSDE